MWDYTINTVHVQDIEGVDTNLQPTVRKRVTYMVGKQGPFVLNYAAGQYTADQAAQDMEKEVAALRTLHDAAQRMT
jgi:hypothetical protein